MPVLQFAPFASLVEPGFWHALTQLKIDVLRLSSDSVPLSASYSTPRSFWDKTTQQEVAIGSNLTLTADAFDKDQSPSNRVCSVGGVLKNFNTVEEFKTADKAAIFNDLADQLWNSNDQSALTRFLLLTFADLKKYKFYYWFAFPSFMAKPAWEIGEDGWQNAGDRLDEKALEHIQQSVSEHPAGCLIRLPSSTSEKPQIAELSNYPEFFADIPSEQRVVAFLDPSAQPDHPGWPLRSLLTHLVRKGPSTQHSFKVLCWRDAEIPSPGRSWKSKLGSVSLPGQAELSVDGPRWSAVGWEKDTRGKMAPRMADLGSMMDPRRLADQATALNLKLMRWRILPSLNLERISTTKVLLLGAGTLGCYVARALMGWGVQKITLVDSAKVSFSNPVRQPLFEYEDCIDGGRDKAQCAAEKMTKIWPGVDATGVTLNIPMPGHPISPTEQHLSQARADVAMLEKLVDEHDAIYLLMDSRESRWLPTVMGASKGKIVINAALGFDSYLVMRHGPRAKSAEGPPPRLGCYYCNDIVAPADSLRDRTLDQMCTVTRPGLAPIAAASAVELMMSLLQHPKGLHSPPPPLGANAASGMGGGDISEEDGGILGLVPHQIRGFLAQFRTMLITGSAYDQCTGCSETVLQAYENEGFDFLLKAFNDSTYLEDLTGLTQLHNDGAAALEQVEWDEEDEEGSI